jgi:hypothetical protein
VWWWVSGTDPPAGQLLAITVTGVPWIATAFSRKLLENTEVTTHFFAITRSWLKLVLRQNEIARRDARQLVARSHPT